MSVSEHQQKEFLAKMANRVAAKPPAPLRVVDDEAAASVANSPPVPASAASAKAALVERTMSFKLAEADYEAIEQIIFNRKRKGEKRLTNKDAGREMVRDWLLKHGEQPFDYGAFE